MSQGAQSSVNRETGRWNFTAYSLTPLKKESNKPGSFVERGYCYLLGTSPICFCITFGKYKIMTSYLFFNHLGYLFSLLLLPPDFLKTFIHLSLLGQVSTAQQLNPQSKQELGRATYSCFSCLRGAGMAHSEQRVGLRSKAKAEVRRSCSRVTLRLLYCGLSVQQGRGGE